MKCLKRIFVGLWLVFSSQIYAESQEEEQSDDITKEEETIELVSNIDLPNTNQSINPEHHYKENISPSSPINFSHQEINQWNLDFLLFGQLEVVLPGVGIAARTQGKSLGFEGALSFFLYLKPAVKCSASLIKSFGNSDWYMGIGVGAFIPFMDAGVQSYFYVPAFFGYQRGSFFGDIGVDLLPIDGVPFPIPALRCGVCF